MTGVAQVVAKQKVDGSILCRARAWVVVQPLCGVRKRSNLSLFLSLSFSLPSSLNKEINKSPFLKKVPLLLKYTFIPACVGFSLLLPLPKPSLFKTEVA